MNKTFNLYKIIIIFRRISFIHEKIQYAGVVKLADTLDLGSNALWCAGSSPVTRTKGKVTKCNFVINFISLIKGDRCLNKNNRTEIVA